MVPCYQSLLRSSITREEEEDCQAHRLSLICRSFKEIDESVQFRLVKHVYFLFLRMINRHVSPIFLEIYNSVAIFNCLNSHEYFLRMSVTDTDLPKTYKLFSKKWNGNLKVWIILSFQGNDSLVVVCLPELFENIRTDCFRFVVLRLLVTREWHSNTFEFLTYDQFEMSRRLAESSSSSRLILKDLKKFCSQVNEMEELCHWWKARARGLSQLTGFWAGNSVVSSSFADSDNIFFLCPVLFTFIAVKSWARKTKHKKVYADSCFILL